MNIHIKNMVCPRCIATVQSLFSSLHIPIYKIELGLVTTKNDLSEKVLAELKTYLQNHGFELLTDKKDKIIQKVKDEIVTIIHYADSAPALNLSAYLSGKLGYEYNYLSNLFSENENITIEKYFIIQRIEKAKEFLSYKELTLTEIAYNLGYSSPSYLSSQFKKVTGFTPTQFLSSNILTRSSIDKL